MVPVTPSPTDSVSEEEVVENVQKALSRPLKERNMIPASQVDKSITGGCSKSKKAKTDSTKSQQIKPFATKYFEEILEKSGLTLSDGTGNHSLVFEPAKFLRNLKSTLENNVDFPRNVTEFVKGFKNCTKDEENFKLFLIKNVYLTAEDSSECRIVQDSVSKFLLNVSCLQELLVDYVLERATEFAIDDKTTWVQMLLKHLMFLDSIVSESKLMNALKELLDVAGHSTRLEIITCLPDIICHLQHESIALELGKYLTEDQELAPAILDCLSYLCLPNDLKAQVHQQMLTILKTSAPPNFFPNLVNFFLTGNNSDTDLDVIRGLRDGLDWTLVGTQSNMDISSSQVMTVLALKNAVAKSRVLAMNWLKVINQVKTDQEHKPLDIIMLLILFSSSNAREKIIEGIFRKRIKAGLFKSELINITFVKFKPVLREYLKEMLKIAKILLKTKTEPSIVEFAANWFNVVFKEMKDSQKAVISELLVRDYTDNDESIVTSLNILTKIATEDISSLKAHSLQIFCLVDMLDNLTVDGIHLVMDLLCGLAFGVDNSFLQSDVHMLINKQLSSSNLEIKIRGIIGGIMAVKHMVCSDLNQESDQTDSEISEIGNLPDGPPKDAATIIDLISKSTSKFPEMICLFYDELAQVLSTCTNIESTFLSWLSSAVTKDLTDIFIIDVDETVTRDVEGIPISVQFRLNPRDEEEGEIALNLVNLCFGEVEESSDLRILPSLFRLTQLVYTKQHHGNLSSIDALLGCGILMPRVDTEIGLEDFDQEQAVKILDCYVFCINWFRELINAFLTQEDLRERVIQRLNALICLERNLARFIKNLSIDYKPPLCSYEPNHTGKNKSAIIQEKAKKFAKKGGQKKKKSVPETDTSIVLPATLRTQPESTQLLPQAAISDSKCKLNLNLFRVLDFEVLNLFEEELVIEDIPVDCLTIPDSKFRPHNILLLLDEISPKLSTILPSKIKKNGFFGRAAPPKQIHRKPEEVIENCFKILPRICYYMETIAESVQKTLDANDGVRDSMGLFTEIGSEAQLCLSSLLNTLSIIFSWSGFQSQNNTAKLKEGLSVLANRRHPEKASNKTSLKELVSESSIYALKYKDWCLLIATAVSLVSFFKVLSKIYEDKITTKKLVLLSLDMLSQTWRDSLGMPEKGLVYNQHLDILLSCYFTKPDVDMIKSLSMELKVQVPLLAEKNRALGTFQCIIKSNFPLLFRATYSALYDAAKLEIDKGLSDNEHLELWKNVATSMKDFTEILKIQENRTNLLTFLKKSIPLLRFFLSHGMPMMELKLRSEPDAVVEILRLLQYSTRFLHSLHCISRLKKDTSFVAYLPQMKLIMETLVYRVKAALSANNCSEAFWMGNLKNKNLQGELIPSQSTTADSDADADDQLPEDDESISSDLEGDLTDAGSKSCSNIV